MHVAEGEEDEWRLFEKLEEETAELRKGPSAAELADLLVVLDTLSTELGVEEAEPTRLRGETAADSGRFEDGVVLERVGS